PRDPPMTHLLDYLGDRVLLCDGPIGTQVQARQLDIERDFWGHENCTEILCESRPDLVLEIHRGYLAAGCDAIAATDSFGGSPITLGEFGIADKAFALNRRAAELAREAIAEFAHDGRTRFVLGSVGPGTRLVGADIAAAATIIHALDVPVIGLNCATGPREMAEHVRWLGENWPGHISLQPNAGLPELIGGRTHYPLTPRELAQWLERFVLEDGVNIIGGCCGTEAAHIAALDQMLRRIGRDRSRPAPKQRQPAWTPSVASLYSQVAFRQE